MTLKTDKGPTPVMNEERIIFNERVQFRVSDLPFRKWIPQVLRIIDKAESRDGKVEIRSFFTFAAWYNYTSSLEKLGLVRRGVFDGRTHSYFLTEKGKELLKIYDELWRFWDDYLFTPMGLRLDPFQPLPFYGESDEYSEILIGSNGKVYKGKTVKR